MSRGRDDHDVDPAFPIAFADGDGHVVVNFGILTGREATQAEVDRLADSLRDASMGPEITITAARRQEYSIGGETVLHQVHVSAPDGSAASIERLCAEWAMSCARDRSLEPLG
jgi:hypothetical protein